MDDRTDVMVYVALVLLCGYVRMRCLYVHAPWTSRERKTCI